MFLLPGKSHSSFGFPKGSPLIPFFRHAYNKLRQTGALHRHNKKWRTRDESIGCGSKNELAPISFNKIVSLVALLLLGIFLALITIMFEKMGKQCSVVPGGARGARGAGGAGVAPPELDRSDNPISTRGDRLCTPTN